MKLGVFDSGVGGITVLRELRKAFPGIDYVYLGDTAHVPYGTKSAAQIERFSVDCARTLKDRGIEALVVACNTASSLVLPAIRVAIAPIPVLGVVEPGVGATVAAVRSMSLAPVSASEGAEIEDTSEAPPVLVLATRATVNSHAYGKALSALLPSSEIIEQACPLLVPMIEEGWTDHPILHQTIQEYVGPHLRVLGDRAGVALLGCTHYPWIQAAFERALPGWTVVNSASAVTAGVAEAFAGVMPAVTAIGAAGSNATATIEWIFTDPLSVPAFARAFMTTPAV